MGCLGDSVCRIMSSVNKDSFIFFLSNLDAFNFTCIIAVSSTILESSDESSQSCLVTDLRGKALSFTVDVYGVSMGFSWMSFIVLRKFPSIPGLLNIFIMKQCCIFVKCSLCVYGGDHVFFSLCSINRKYYIDCFSYRTIFAHPE